MADQDNFEKGIMSKELESGSDGKGQVGSDKDAPVDNARTHEAPEWIRNLSPEDRRSIEAKLKWKIDLRLMPMIIISML